VANLAPGCCRQEADLLLEHNYQQYRSELDDNGSLALESRILSRLFASKNDHQSVASASAVAFICAVKIDMSINHPGE